MEKRITTMSVWCDVVCRAITTIDIEGNVCYQYQWLTRVFIYYDLFVHFVLTILNMWVKSFATQQGATLKYRS